MGTEPSTCADAGSTNGIRRGLRDVGAIVEGEHPIINGEPQRIPAVDDTRGELTIFYVAHNDGVPNGYAENNRTKGVDSLAIAADRGYFWMLREPLAE